MRLNLPILLLACVLLQGCNPVGLVAPVPHSRNATQVTVLDDTTRQPIAGAVMVAVWVDRTWVPNLSAGYSENSRLTTDTCDGVVYFESALSDSEGHVQLPAWSHVGHCANMAPWSPAIYFYAPGYQCLSMHNMPMAGHGESPVRSEDVDGKVANLSPLPHSFNELKQDSQVLELERYGKMLQSYLYRPFDKPIVCFWDSARPAMLVLKQEERRLSSYMQWYRPDFDFDYIMAHPDSAGYDTKVSCGDQTAYMQALQEEALSTQPEKLSVMPILPVQVSVTSDMPFFRVMADGKWVASPMTVHKAIDRVDIALEPGMHLISGCFSKLQGAQTIVFTIKKTVMISASAETTVSLNSADAPRVLTSSKEDLITCLAR